MIASLVGLDGQPSASIPIFRLPGLSSGAITLQVIMTGPGQATVTILVTSLSTGQTTTLTANIAVGAAVGVFDGPQITALERYGIHMKPTTIVLTFDQPLDPTRAGRQRVSPRRSRGHTIPIKRAVYDPSTMTVTLFPKERINLHHKYKLTVYGATPNGLTGSSGLLLDGKDEGQPGSNYVAAITFSNLVKPSNWDPRWTAQFVHHKPHPAAKHAKHVIRIGKHPLSQRTRPFQTHGAANPRPSIPSLAMRPLGRRFSDKVGGLSCTAGKYRWSPFAHRQTDGRLLWKIISLNRRWVNIASIRPLTANRFKAYDSLVTRLKDSEFPDAFCAGQPSTYSYPRPYRPGEDGVLGFVRSVPPEQTTKPRDPPRPVDLGAFSFRRRR